MSLMCDIFGESDSSGDIMRLMEENKRLYGDLDMPEYKEFNPELYNADSYKYDTIKSDPMIQSRQEQLLAELAGLKDTGLSDVDEAAFARARREANQMAKSNSAAAIQDAQNRGVSGGGMEFAMREIGNQGAANRANEANLDRAAEAAKERALYLQAYGGELGTQRNQNYQQNAANTNIINDFNARNTQQRNTVSNTNVDARNDAFKYNEGLKDKQYDNQLKKIGGMTGANQGIANVYAGRDAAEQSDRNSLVGIGGQLGAAYLGRK